MRRRSARNTKASPEKSSAAETSRKSRRTSRRRKQSSGSDDDEPLQRVIDTASSKLDDSKSASSASDDDGEEPVWKVTQDPMSPAGEIQKIKICLTRPLAVVTTGAVTTATPSQTSPSTTPEKLSRRSRKKSASSAEDTTPSGSDVAHSSGGGRRGRRSRNSGVSPGVSDSNSQEETAVLVAAADDTDAAEDKHAKKGKSRGKHKHSKHDEQGADEAQDVVAASASVDDNNADDNDDDAPVVKMQNQSEISEHVQVTTQSPAHTADVVESVHTEPQVAAAVVAIDIQSTTERDDNAEAAAVAADDIKSDDDMHEKSSGKSTFAQPPPSAEIQHNDDVDGIVSEVRVESGKKANNGGESGEKSEDKGDHPIDASPKKIEVVSQKAEHILVPPISDQVPITKSNVVVSNKSDPTDRKGQTDTSKSVSIEICRSVSDKEDTVLEKQSIITSKSEGDTESITEDKPNIANVAENNITEAESSPVTNGESDSASAQDVHIELKLDAQEAMDVDSEEEFTQRKSASMNRARPSSYSDDDESDDQQKIGRYRTQSSGRRDSTASTTESVANHSTRKQLPGRRSSFAIEKDRRNESTKSSSKAVTKQRPQLALSKLPPVTRKRKWGPAVFQKHMDENQKDNMQIISSLVLLEWFPNCELLPESDMRLELNAISSSSAHDAAVKRLKRLDSDATKDDDVRANREDGSKALPILRRPSHTDGAADDQSQIITQNRKISIIEDIVPPARAPSPAANLLSPVLIVTNLVRPFTLKQLKELLERTGKIVHDGFWTDRIKSKCIVHYATSEEAEATRNALHGIIWPPGNGKKLAIDYSTATVLEETRNPPPSPRPAETIEKENKVPAAMHTEANKEKVQSLDKEEDDKTRHEHVRERDVGKPSERGDHRRTRSRSRDQRSRRSPEPKEKKREPMEEPPPQKRMDDLFQKTLATPSIYWQPLSPEEIALKQQQRLERMAEHKRRMEHPGNSANASGGLGSSATGGSDQRDRQQHHRGGGGFYRRRY